MAERSPCRPAFRHRGTRPEIQSGGGPVATPLGYSQLATRRSHVMNRRSCIAAVLAALSMTLAAGALAQQGLKTGKIGVIVQLSGVSADFGVGVQHAVEIAKQELAEKGIVNLQ